jgi:hypothetical protein
VLNGSQDAEVRSEVLTIWFTCPDTVATWEESPTDLADSRVPAACLMETSKQPIQSDHQTSTTKPQIIKSSLTKTQKPPSTILRPLPKSTHSTSNHMLNILHARRFQRMHKFTLLRMIQSSPKLRHILTPKARVRHQILCSLLSWIVRSV